MAKLTLDQIDAKIENLQEQRRRKDPVALFRVDQIDAKIEKLQEQRRKIIDAKRKGVKLM